MFSNLPSDCPGSHPAASSGPHHSATQTLLTPAGHLPRLVIWQGAISSLERWILRVYSPTVKRQDSDPGRKQYLTQSLHPFLEQGDVSLPPGNEWFRLCAKSLLSQLLSCHCSRRATTDKEKKDAPVSRFLCLWKQKP